MDAFLKSDIFFFITGIAVILVASACLIVLAYAIRILADIRAVSRRLADGSRLISEDLDAFRRVIREEGVRLRHIFDFSKNVYSKSRAHRNSKRRSRTES